MEQRASAWKRLRGKDRAGSGPAASFPGSVCEQQVPKLLAVLPKALGQSLTLLDKRLGKWGRGAQAGRSGGRVEASGQGARLVREQLEGWSCRRRIREG